VDDLGEREWCLVGVEVSSAKTEGCDCTKNSLVSINKPNYKTPEESHATGYSKFSAPVFDLLRLVY
jgi:hypothetical protein